MADPAGNTDLPRAPRWERIVLCFLLVVFVVVPCCGLPVVCLNYGDIQVMINRVPFDSKEWKAAQDPSIRYDMSWDLRRGLLHRKSMDEVEELLGKPGNAERIQVGGLPLFDSARAEPGTDVWYYDLGGEKYEPGIGPSGAVLAVEFRDGNVVRVRKVVH